MDLGIGQLLFLDPNYRWLSDSRASLSVFGIQIQRMRFSLFVKANLSDEDPESMLDNFILRW